MAAEVAEEVQSCAGDLRRCRDGHLLGDEYYVCGRGALSGDIDRGFE